MLFHYGMKEEEEEQKEEGGGGLGYNELQRI